MYRITKRMLDIILSSAGLIVCIPLFMLIALLIKITSPGPIFEIQRKIGLNEHLFKSLRFRTMLPLTDSNIDEAFLEDLLSGSLGPEKGKVDHKMGSDSRFTPIGLFLKATGLVELPQLINVLRGDMSLVGPYPAFPYEVEQRPDLLARERLKCKPGITGLWQVSRVEPGGFDQMIEMDMEYIRHQSILLDLKILFKTFVHTLSAKRAI